MSSHWLTAWQSAWFSVLETRCNTERNIVETSDKRRESSRNVKSVCADSVLSFCRFRWCRGCLFFVGLDWQFHVIVVHPSVTMTMKELKKETTNEDETHTEKILASLYKIKRRAVEKVVGHDQKSDFLVTVSNSFRFISPKQKTISIHHSLLLWIHVTMYLSNIQADCFKRAVDPWRRLHDQCFRCLLVGQQLMFGKVSWSTINGLNDASISAYDCIASK